MELGGNMSKYYFDVYSVVTKPVYADVVVTTEYHRKRPDDAGYLSYTFDNTTGVYTLTNYRDFGKDMRGNIDANGTGVK